jgi:hypothetical protein
MIVQQEEVRWQIDDNTPQILKLSVMPACGRFQAIGQIKVCMSSKIINLGVVNLMTEFTHFKAD